MTLFKNKYRIESTRLKGWDYANAGWYFVTICTKNREWCLGEIVVSETRLSPIGEIARQFWLEIPQRSRGKIEIDAFVVMPNHVHGIIVINVGDVVRGRDVACNVSTTNVSTENVSTGNGATSNLPVSAAMSKISAQGRIVGRNRAVVQIGSDALVRNEPSAVL